MAGESYWCDPAVESGRLPALIRGTSAVARKSPNSSGRRIRRALDPLNRAIAMPAEVELGRTHCNPSRRIEPVRPSEQLAISLLVV